VCDKGANLYENHFEMKVFCPRAGCAQSERGRKKEEKTWQPMQAKKKK